MVKLYSLPGCPMCDMLAEKLDANKIQYTKVTGTDVMKIQGITHVPMLETEDGKLLSLADAMRYIEGVTV